MNILIVGAGAVGQVYGRHLQLGGDRVSFLVREKYKNDFPDGFTMYPLRSRGRTVSVQFRPEKILTSLTEVAAETWDQVWLCVPGTSLDPTWVKEIVDSTGNSTVVLFPAGIGTIEKLTDVLPSQRAVAGIIPMMSHFVTADGKEHPKDGVAYWFPPLSPTLLTGDSARRTEVINALRRGKLSGAAHKNVRQAAAIGSAILMPHIVALEGAGWSYQSLSHSPLFGDSVLATREAVGAAASHLAISPPLLPRLLRPWIVRIIIGLLQFLAPLNVEEFFKVHFTKVRDQTKHQMSEYIRIAKSAGLPTSGLTRLTTTVFKTPQLSAN